MQITYLGHAGFIVETNDCVVLMDAWLSPRGAFDSGWFQLPCNHFMIDAVHQVFKHSTKEKLVYVSHEHKDHFCKDTLLQLEPYDFAYVIPQFKRDLLYRHILQFTTKKINLLHDEEKIKIGNTTLEFFLDDNELNRDSAILIQDEARTFLNMNDCKLNDRLPAIKQKVGNIDYFTTQFSGATWHPTCYEYEKAEYERISIRKNRGKFESVAKAIETVEPSIFFPSAGPPCFLDPKLIHYNFQEINIFPREHKIKSFLQKRLDISVQLESLYPSDVIDSNGKIIRIKRFNDYTTNFKNYVEQYAESKQELFQNKYSRNVEVESVFNDLQIAFQQKLNAFTAHKTIERNLYITCPELPQQSICINFKDKKAMIEPMVPEQNFYRLDASIFDFKRVLDGCMTWEDFCLTFRMRLFREPDIYQVLMQGFLILEKEDLQRFCEHIYNLENNNERITIEIGGNTYSMHRYCPHQGADLKHAWIEEERYIVCPRHRWRFDVLNEGKCEQNDGCIFAIPLSE